MKILRADHLGMCFGVRDAITLALDISRSEPLTILGDLVHNETVLADLRQRGIVLVTQPIEALTNTVMITAHGASQKAITAATRLGHQVVEATCPLVQAAHRAVHKLARDGFHPVIIGKRDHVEVRGLTGDLEAFDVVSSEAEVVALAERPRFGVAAQTTQPIEHVRRLVETLRQRFPNSEVRFIDTVCQPTKQRQHAALELAQKSQVVIVIGGEHSNNTRELVATCRRYCPQVHHIQSPEELQADWFAGVETVGITAGTSTPDSSIVEVEAWLHRFAATRAATALPHLATAAPTEKV